MKPSTMAGLTKTWHFGSPIRAITKKKNSITSYTYSFGQSFERLKQNYLYQYQHTKYSCLFYIGYIIKMLLGRVNRPNCSPMEFDEHFIKEHKKNLIDYSWTLSRAFFMEGFSVLYVSPSVFFKYVQN